MEVRTLLKRGTDHPVNCEDDLFTFDDGTTYIGAVFDGCSTGTKSHFASTLYGKLLKRYCANFSAQLTNPILKRVGRNIYASIYANLKSSKNALELETLEILSTMILVIVRDKKAYILVSGDGCIYVDGQEIKLESEGNAPDYLAYHLDHELEGFLSLKEYEFDFEHTISVCSDGIYSFTDTDKKDVSTEVIINLLEDNTILKSEAMLGRKHNLLLKKGYSNYDDLSIVRFIL